jgi:hypothetical protein
VFDIGGRNAVAVRQFGTIFVRSIPVLLAISPKNVKDLKPARV